MTRTVNVFYQGEAVVANDGPMFRIHSVEKKKSVNSFALCLFEDEKLGQFQVLACVHEIWKWHPVGQSERQHCKYAMYVRCKKTTLTSMHEPTSWYMYVADISIARGSAAGEFVAFPNVSLVNPILVPFINNIGGIRSASHTCYYVIDPADAVAQWDDVA